MGLLSIIILLVVCRLLTASEYLIPRCALPTTDGLSSDRLTFPSETSLPTRSWDNEYSSSSCRILLCFYPRKMSQNLLNRPSCRSFVKKCAIIFSLGRYSTLILPYFNISLIPKYLFSICLIFWPLDIFPLSSILIALWLSWKMIFSSIVNP